MVFICACTKLFLLLDFSLDSKTYEALLFSTAFSVRIFPFLRWGNSHYEQRGDSLKVISISDVEVCSTLLR